MKIAGPLRVHPKNPRYFTDGSGRAVLLVGSHTWDNLQETARTEPPKSFDNEEFLNFLTERGHNFFRLWCWEEAWWPMKNLGTVYFDPMPFERTGPGAALDGKPRFNLDKFNERYFQKMRQRVVAAGERGFYVSIMLFDGWSIEKKNSEYGSPWPGHYFNRDNNASAVDGDPDNVGDGRATHQLRNAAVTRVQERYVAKVVETVGDLPNVLYEISNESGGDSYEWQYHMIRTIHELEAKRPMRHPVGMTVPFPGGDNQRLMTSPSEWISPKLGSDPNSPDVADGRKVILDDTDHLWGIGGDRHWAWKSFVRGRNPLFMDPYTSKTVWWDELKEWDENDPRWESLRRNLGYIRRLSLELDLAAMAPRGELCSTGYCLATQPGAARAELVAYQPAKGPMTLDLAGTAGQFSVRWLRPADGSDCPGSQVSGGKKVNLAPPFAGDAVAYLSTAKDAKP